MSGGFRIQFLVLNLHHLEISCGAPPKDDPINNRPTGCGDIASAGDKQDQIGCILKAVKLPEMENPVKGCGSVEDPSIKNLFDAKSTPRNAKSEKDEREKDSKHRDNIVKAENMDEVIDGTELGEKLREGGVEKDESSSRKTKQPVYKLKRKVELRDSTKLKDESKFTLDRLHRDYLEWYDKNGDGKGALNLNGTKNIEKSPDVQNRNLFGKRK